MASANTQDSRATPLPFDSVNKLRGSLPELAWVAHEIAAHFRPTMIFAFVPRSVTFSIVA